MRNPIIAGIGLAILFAAVRISEAGNAALPTSPTIVVVGTTSATVAATAPTSPGLSNDPVAVKWLRTLEERHKDHRRASGEFNQAKKDPVFQEDVRSSGKFYYERPDRFRCDYLKPDPSSHLVIGDVVTNYLPDFKEVLRHRLSREGSGISEVNQMLLAFGIDTDKVLKYFTVTSDPKTSVTLVRLTFVPKGPREQRPFARFVLDLTKPDLTPKQFLIVGDDDDQTSVVITRITWNDPSIPSDIFQLKIPRDVEIIDEE